MTTTTTPAYIWDPIRCTLQLVFSRPNKSTAIRAGSTYHGTSVIRYRRQPYRDVASGVDDTGGSSVSSSLGSSEYDAFVRHRRVVAEKNALHFHALTKAGGLYKDAAVLEVHSYQVKRVSAPGGAATGVLRVLSVEVEDDVATPPGTHHTCNTEKTKKGCKQKKRNGATATEGDAHFLADSSGSSATVDWGSKLVFFVDGSTLTPFSEVELIIQFSGKIQLSDHGGIYAARCSDGGDGNEDVPLLTHFEVRFARCAFPSPDDPQYRVEWHLKSLQLPCGFDTILTNGEMRSRKEVVAQQAVQMSFAPCGPIPAYVFSFACFPHSGKLKRAVSAVGGFEVAEGSVDIMHFPGDLSDSLGDHGALSVTTVPVRVLARPEARIAPATLERVLKLTIESVNVLQDLFQCPLPLLQCEHLDVLLGPTMPYISGMEHHCSIILNETIYQTNKKTSAPGCAGGGGGANTNNEVEQTELIVHELTHHWVGNALGFPFAVKEGICQVIEQCVGDTLLGKPMRKYKADGDASATPPNALSSSLTTPSTMPMSTIKSSEKGHEFTGISYQDALNAIKRLVAQHGFDHFIHCLRQLFHTHIISPAVAIDESGGVEALRLIGADIPPPPYLSTAHFLRAMADLA